MLARHKSLPLCWPQRLKSRLHPLRGKTASDMVCLKLRAPQNVRLGSDSPKTLSQLTGCCGRPSRRHDGTRRTMAVSGRIHRFNLPARCLFFFVCYLMHLFLLVDSCSIPSVASKFRSGTLLLNLAMYCMFVNVYYIYILDDLDGQIQVPVVPVILFNDDVLPFRFPWAPHRKTD